MRLREIVREAWRNTATGTSRPLVLATMLAVSLGLGVVFAAVQTASAAERYDAYLTSGAATTILRSPGGIDAERCAALNDVRGVVGAVAFRVDPNGMALAVLPSFPQARVLAVGDPLAVLGGAPATGPGLLLSHELAAQLGLTPGDSLALADAPATLAGTFPYPDDGRLPLLSTAVVELVARSDAPFDQCWVTVWPPREELRSLMTSAVIPIENQPAEIQLLGSALGAPAPWDDLIVRSNIGWLRAGAALLALVLGFSWVRSRRVEFALALHLGQNRRAMIPQALIEASIVLWIVAPAAVVVSMLTLAPHVGAEALAIAGAGAVATALGVVAAAYAGVIMALATVSETKVSDWAKDR